MRITKRTYNDVAETIFTVVDNKGRYAGSARVKVGIDGTPEAIAEIKKSIEVVIREAAERLNPPKI